MLNNIRNFSKTLSAKVLLVIIIIPFVFWGMGGVFNRGNTNNIVKINNHSISAQDFMDYLNNSRIDANVIKENINNNILEELLSGLISNNLLEMEMKKLNLLVDEKSLAKRIMENEKFKDENGNFSRTKYEKFLLENNISAPIFEQRLKLRELQKKLFEYISAGSISPEFLIIKNFEEENMKLQIEYLNLFSFYKKKEALSNKDLEFFISENKENLKIEYLDFKYAVLNPQSLFGIDEFNQAFFDKIDDIEIKISNNEDIKSILQDSKIKVVGVKNFKDSSEKKDIEKKIFELRNIKFDIIENKNDYILYKINNIEERSPDISDQKLKKEVLQLLTQKNKFDYNRKLYERIKENKFTESEFKKMGGNDIKTLMLSSIRDNKKFEINSIELLYSLPVGSFTLINDEKDNIYLTKITNIINKTKSLNEDNFKEYADKENTNSRKNILKSYDILLNEKYNVVLNQKTIERVKNFFQ